MKSSDAIVENKASSCLTILLQILTSLRTKDIVNPYPRQRVRGGRPRVSLRAVRPTSPTPCRAEFTRPTGFLARTSPPGLPGSAAPQLPAAVAAIIENDFWVSPLPTCTSLTCHEKRKTHSSEMGAVACFLPTAQTQLHPSEV